ncbi:hypothetical protein [Mycobacterium simiae]|uniref:Uncharacterized protein n=1 Tax=Mycobacterium simiae TaxID=1784 RepID=A0A1X0XVY3_MYCSI|nr:hypothetical protein [Mycobacterium simiae]ORJ57028.1 hypothetical protein B5M45_23565 [Mycobacterium simiae]
MLAMSPILIRPDLSRLVPGRRIGGRYTLEQAAGIVTMMLTTMLTMMLVTMLARMLTRPRTAALAGLTP